MSVVDPGGEPRFLLEAGEGVGAGLQRGRDLLEGDPALEDLVVGLVDRAHPPLAQLAQQAVVLDVARRAGRGGRRADGDGG